MEPAELRRRYRRIKGTDKCAICWIPEKKLYGRRCCDQLQLAHIISRGVAGKKANFLTNVLMLCERCHRSQHEGGVVTDDGSYWPDVTTDIMLRVKRDRNELSTKVLAEIWGRTEDWVVTLSTVTIPPEIWSIRNQWRGW